jgi:spore maturation protein CgeB
MRFLIVDQYYPEFLQTYYRHYHATNNSYVTQQQLLMAELFSTADFYSVNLSKLGHPAQTIVVNDDRLQQVWQKENQDLNLSLRQRSWDQLLKLMPFFSSRRASIWEEEVLRRQIAAFRPDVLYLQNISYLSQSFLCSIKKQVRLIVGQVACPIPPFQKYTAYDLMITSLPNLVDKFKKMAVMAEYLPLCFEPSILRKLPKLARKYPLTFIGGITSVHKVGTDLLQQIAQKMPIDMWGYGKENLPADSPAYRHHHGEAWGKDMYKLFLQSQITINRHSAIAENFANNQRLFEATGCGALLMTEEKSNLNRFFKVGKEIISYQSANDLITKIRYYATHQTEREKIARAGQRRTLREHVYRVRMKELTNILERYL